MGELKVFMETGPIRTNTEHRVQIVFSYRQSDDGLLISRNVYMQLIY